MSNYTKILIIIGLFVGILNIVVGILNIVVGIYKKDFYQILSGVLFLEAALNMKTIERKKQNNRGSR